MIEESMPFGGIAMSGWCKELSRHSLDKHRNVKAVWIDTGS
jgi:acyl-CoA reductase-like NAD-dependent aldehyde dehydrogenase